MNSVQTFFSGTSNVVLPVPNKNFFPTEYQDKSRLCYYASLFNTVEVNSCFYKLPLTRTIEKWAADVPAGFRFTFKLWQEITHKKDFDFDAAHVSRFMDIIAAAGDKKGCLLVQFPPGLAINLIKLEHLLNWIQRANTGNAWKVAVEFRNRSWYNLSVYEMIDSYHAGMVVHDLPASATPMMETAADFVYLRFHGPEGGYRGSYSDDFLQEYAYYINDWQQEGKTVYAYFNNTMGNAVQNLMTLNRFVNSMNN